MKKFTIINDDFYKYIKNVKTDSVGLILTDPPYTINKYSTGNIQFKNRKDMNDDIANWDAIEFMRILLPKGNIISFTNSNQIGNWHRTFDPKFDTFQFFIWHKTNPPPQIRKVSFLNSCELIICCWNKGHTWNFGKQNEMHNFFESHLCMGKERCKHPTQKPLGILKHLIKIASNPDDLVFDPFMGTGSIGIAAIELDRKFLGIEIDKKYFTLSYVSKCNKMTYGILFSPVLRQAFFKMIVTAWFL